MAIDCAFFGFLPADAERKVASTTGKPWVRLRVGVGKDETIQWVQVAVFGKAADAAAKLKKGDRIYCEGTIRMDSWRGSDGAERHGLNVASVKIEQTHQIGRNKPRRERVERPTSTRSAALASGPGFYDDPIPFAPELR